MWVLALLFVALLCRRAEGAEVEASVHQCVKAARKLQRRTHMPPFVKPVGPDEVEPYVDPKLIEPCLMCEPANEFCPDGCQKLLDFFFAACPGICLPETYFFDPHLTMAGCFSDYGTDLRRHAQRCGCNSAMGGAVPGTLLLTFVLVTTSYLLAF